MEFGGGKEYTTERNGRSSWEWQGIIAFCTCQWNNEYLIWETYKYQTEKFFGCHFWNKLQYQLLASQSIGKSCCRDLFFMGVVLKVLLLCDLRMLIPHFLQQTSANICCGLCVFEYQYAPTSVQLKHYIWHFLFVQHQACYSFFPPPHYSVYFSFTWHYSTEYSISLPLHAIQHDKSHLRFQHC